MVPLPAVHVPTCNCDRIVTPVLQTFNKSWNHQLLTPTISATSGDELPAPHLQSSGNTQCYSLYAKVTKHTHTSSKRGGDTWRKRHSTLETGGPGLITARERERGTSELAEKDSRPSRQTVEPKMALVWFETEAAGDRSLSKTSFRPEVDLPPPSSSECRTRGTVSQAVAVLQRGR